MNKFMEMRAWGHGLSHPIYVPRDFDDVKLMLSQGMISAACHALWQRAALGSDSAAALLGYIDLRDGLADGIDRAEVTIRCVNAANRNDGFAQYVVAWKAYQLGDFSVFGKWLDRSARQGFVPAIVDAARIKVQTRQATKASRRNSKTNFWVAFKLGHVASAGVFFLCCGDCQKFCALSRFIND